MKRDKEAGAKIRALRKSQKPAPTQAQFAKSFGVTQSMISAWEAGRDTPSAEIWIKLGELAGYPDCYWFYARAGLDPQKLLAATEKLFKERIQPTDSPLVEGRTVLVPRVQSLRGLEPAGLPVPMPVQLVPNPSSTYCLGISFTPGQFDRWAIVDTADAEAEDLGPFWGLPALIEFAPIDQAPPLWPGGLEIGTLFLEEDEQNPDGTPWYARFLGPYPGGMLIGTSMRIGRWIESRQSRIAATLQSEEAVPGLEEGWDAKRVAVSIRSGRALREMRLAPGCKIIGRVITWWYGIQEPKKTNS